MEVTFYNGEISVVYMSKEDTRVALEPENKILVDIDIDAARAAAEHVRDRNLDQSWEEMITTEIQKAAIYACQQSLDTMTEAKKEISEKLLAAGNKILYDEPKYLDKVKAIYQRELEQKKREIESKVRKRESLKDIDSAAVSNASFARRRLRLLSSRTTRTSICPTQDSRVRRRWRSS